jgi:FKBP-type peptidyl-prolyl cis-trans isomerase
MAWGPHRLRTEVAAAFDTKLPAGAPAFALTPAGKGTKTPSGLVYEQLRAGSGASPGPTDRMHVHYAGWLADGTLLESSHVRGEPGVLRSEWVVKGLAEGLQLMQPGSTFRFTIRPELAYGKEGNGRVPPDSTLVYEVTLLGSDKL